MLVFWNVSRFHWSQGWPSILVKFAVVNMDGYETDEILSQALDLAEDVENDTIFITQSTFQNNEDILHVLKKARNRANPKIYV